MFITELCELRQNHRAYKTFSLLLVDKNKSVSQQHEGRSMKQTLEFIILEYTIFIQASMHVLICRDLISGQQ